MADVKKCKLCNKEFYASHGNKKFCSDKCFHSFYERYHQKWKKEHPKIEKDYVKSGDRAYNNIRQRCTNPRHRQYSNYGARGITLELTREEFKEIYFSTDNCENCGKKLDDENRMGSAGRSLDRLDQARSYEKDNLRILCRGCNTRFAYERRKYKLK